MAVRRQALGARVCPATLPRRHRPSRRLGPSPRTGLARPDALTSRGGRGSVGDMLKLASRSTLTTLALVSPLALIGCKDTPTPRTLPVTIEFAEVTESGAVRHLFDGENNPIDLGIASSIKIDGSLELLFESSKMVGLGFLASSSHAADLRAWTAAKPNALIALIIDDQVYQQAHIPTPLAGTVMMRAPTVYRAPRVAGFVNSYPR